MHYVKAFCLVVLGIGTWIIGYFVALILFLGLCVYALGIAIKMEKDDDDRGTGS